MRLALAATGLLAVAAGCAPAPAHTAALQVDTAFAGYVNRFEQASAQYGQATQVTDLTIRFGAVASDEQTAAGSTARAACETVSGQTPVITVSPEAWAASSDSEREELVFHELGHCVLGLTHVAGINEDGIPRSLMNPAEIDGAIYRQNRDFYVQGIFVQAQQHAGMSAGHASASVSTN